MTHKHVRIRMGIVGGLLGCALGATVYRAYKLQVDRRTDLSRMAADQYLQEIELPPWRGTIRDRGGEPLAISVEVDSVYANPREVGDRAAAVAARLAPMLDMKPDAIQERLGDRKFFAWIKRRVMPEEAERVRAAAAAGTLKGVYTIKEPRRVYPDKELAAQTLGFCGSESTGLAGLEQSLDAQLRGTPRHAPGLRDALGRSLLPAGLPDDLGTSGHDVVLTLDRQVQHFAERALRTAVEDHHAQAGFAVVLDPASGAVLALASEPTFNPNLPESADPWRQRNRALTDAFEPGSVAKIFSLSAAMEAGLVREEDRFFCENGRWPLGGYTIHDAHPYDWLDLGGVIQKSSNICTAKIALRLGKQRLHAALQRFGFGHPTGLELRGERAGVLRKPEEWADVTTANVSFGQGFTATGLQLAAALAAVANGGRWVRPHLVAEVRDGDRTVEAPASETRGVIGAEIARRMAKLMVKVTETGGTGTRAAIPGYAVAGKTATAQKVDPVTGTYSNEKFLSMFMGFVPAEAPRLVAVVGVDEPVGEHYGGLVAAPAFKEIAEQTLRYLGVARDGGAVAAAPAAPAPERDGPSPSSLADGFVTPDDAVAGATEGNTSVPDFTGMSLAEALDAARRAGIKPLLEGSGTAVAQSPGPGPAPSGATVMIRFQPPG